MDFGFKESSQSFATPDAFNFNPGGQVSHVPTNPFENNGPPPKTLEQTAREYVQKQQQLNDAIRQRNRIENFNKQSVPSRDVEVLPRETFDGNRPRMRNITPIDEKQAISELLEEQVRKKTPTARPSPATPPIDIDATPARATPLKNPTVTPRPAKPMRLGGKIPSPKTRPSNLPIPAGTGKFLQRVGYVGNAIDFTNRVVKGQNPIVAGIEVGAGTVGGIIGSTAGAVVGGALGGPAGAAIGGFYGGLLGGFVGGEIGKQVSSALLPSEKFEAPTTPDGGKLPIQYEWNYSTNLNPRSKALDNLAFLTTGPISDFEVTRVVNRDTSGGQEIAEWEARFKDGDGSYSYGRAVGYYPDDKPKLVIARADGKALAQKKGTIPSDNRSLLSRYHPANNYVPRRANLDLAVAPNNYAPGGLVDGGTARGDAPDWVPHAYPAPRQNPNPTTTPSNLGGNFPSYSPTTPTTPTAPTAPTTPTTPRNYRIEGPASNPTPTGSGNANPIPFNQPRISKIPNTKNNPSPQPDGLKTPRPVSNPPPEKASQIQIDLCNSPCFQGLKEQADSNQIFWSDVEVNIVKCELKDGEYTPTLEPKVIKVLSTKDGSEVLKTQLEFKELEKINTCICKLKNEQAIAVLPLGYQIRPEGDRPQLILQCGEVTKDGNIKSAKYPISIPHFKGYKLKESPLKEYVKGNFEYILVLKDNSRITIHTINEKEAEKVIQQLKKIIKPEYVVGSYGKGGFLHRKEKIKEIKVKPKIAKYFSKGQKDTNPDWIVRLNKEKKN